MPKLLQGTLKKPSKDEIPECVSLRKNVLTLNEILFLIYKTCIKIPIYSFFWLKLAVYYSPPLLRKIGLTLSVSLLKLVFYIISFLILHIIYYTGY